MPTRTHYLSEGKIDTCKLLVLEYIPRCWQAYADVRMSYQLQEPGRVISMAERKSGSSELSSGMYCRVK